jgi:competence protein ComEC
MSVWHTIPLLRLIIPFIAGIILGIEIDRELHVPWWFFALLFLSLAAFMRWPKVMIPYRHRWIMGALVHVILFLLGFELSIRNTEKYAPDHFSLLINPGADHYYRVEITEPPVVKNKSVRVSVCVRYADTADHNPITGHGILYLERDSLSEGLSYGDLILVRARWQEVNGPRNPYAFDYRKYLSRKGIYHQAYIKSRQWSLTSRAGGNILFRTAWRWREYLVGILRNNKLSGEELAVGGAILLGEYQNFDPELLRAYSGAGVTHILSVSGLHVGIVFIVFSTCLFFLNRNRKTKLIKAILLILMTWFYALLTGLSPPVERSAAMFTFIITGQAIHRKCHILNTLSASAFLLLLINPFLIMDIGFQLTYLAVAGIVILEKPLYEAFVMPNKWLDRIWKLIAVTIAAQLATGPLAIYCFHQFPVYFIPANLVIIPWSTVVMYSGMAALSLAPVAIAGLWLTKAFSFSILVMNCIIFFVERLPLSVIRDLNPSIPETIGIYLLVASAAISIVQKRATWLVLSAALLFLLCVSWLIRDIRLDHQHRFLVYDIRNTAALGIIEGRKHFLISDTAFLMNDDLQRQQLGNLWTRWGIRQKTKVSIQDDLPEGKDAHLWKKGNYLQFHGKRIVLVRDSVPCYPPENPLAVDYLVLIGNPKIKIERLLQYFRPHQVIFSGNCRRWKVRQWMMESNKMGINCYDIARNGALVVEM